LGVKRGFYPHCTKPTPNLTSSKAGDCTERLGIPDSLVRFQQVQRGEVTVGRESLPQKKKNTTETASSSFGPSLWHPKRRGGQKNRKRKPTYQLLTAYTWLQQKGNARHT